MVNAKSSLTRRTLHYYWQVTRRHKALFAALMASTFAFVALLSYGNPYVMSLIVDQVSAQPVEADQVFTVFGPYIAALILIKRLWPSCQQAAGLHHVQAGNCRLIRFGNYEL